MQQKINLTQVICLRIGKTIEAKPHRVILKSQLPIIYYYQSQTITSIKNLTKPFGLSRNTNLQLNPYPNTQLDLYCSSNLSVQCTNPNMWLTNDVRILVRDWLHGNHLIDVVDLQQLHIETPIRSLMMVWETLLDYRTQRRTRNAARTLSSIGGG